MLLKREDLAHTGSHKINNVLGQALLAQRMGKQRLLAETGAGQHGVATATAGSAARPARPPCSWASADIERQAAQRVPDAAAGRQGRPGDQRQPHPQGRLQRGDAALGVRRWTRPTTASGSVMGPHPYPWMVREFQRVIGDGGPSPVRGRAARGGARLVVACVGGGSNAAGTFAGFVDTSARLVGVEAAGGAAIDLRLARGAARLPLARCCRTRRPGEGGALDRGRPGLPGRRPRARPPGRLSAGPEYVTVTDERGARGGASAGPHARASWPRWSRPTRWPGYQGGRARVSCQPARRC